MARWYARFDSGSAGWESGFAAGLSSSGYFEKLQIGASELAGSILRDGLIASRSIISTDVYEDLDIGNIDGSKGTYFPPNLLTVPNNPFTGTAYTSSFDGIKTPTTNTYGTGQVNYSKRPTASVLSDNPIVGITNPVDTVQVSYTSYNNASAAVKAVLDAIQTGNGTPKTPYTRPGLNEGRTLHSIWHDPDLTYFAWDDFTPGNPQAFAVTFPQAIGGNLYVENTDTVSAVFTWQPEYAADRSGSAPITAAVTRDDNEEVIDTLSTTVSNGNLFYSWSIAASDFPENTAAPYSYEYDVTSSIKFVDATITSHESTPAINNVDKLVEVFKLAKITQMYTSGPPNGTLQDLCNDTTPQDLYMNGDVPDWSVANFIWSNKEGAAAVAGYWARLGDDFARQWDGGNFGSDVSPLPCGTITGNGGGGGTYCGQQCTQNSDCTGDPQCTICNGSPGVCVPESIE